MVALVLSPDLHQAGRAFWQASEALHPTRDGSARPTRMNQRLLRVKVVFWPKTVVIARIGVSVGSMAVLESSANYLLEPTAVQKSSHGSPATLPTIAPG